MPNVLKFPKDVGFRSDVQTFAWVLTVTSFTERAIYCFAANIPTRKFAMVLMKKINTIS